MPGMNQKKTHMWGFGGEAFGQRSRMPLLPPARAGSHKPWHLLKLGLSAGAGPGRPKGLKA